MSEILKRHIAVGSYTLQKDDPRNLGEVIVEKVKAADAAVSIEGNLSVSGSLAIPANTNVFKVVKKTIGVVGKTGKDLVFTSAANTTPQNHNLGALIPAYSVPVSIVLRCTEAVKEGASAKTMTFKLGTQSNGDEVWDAARNDGADDVTADYATTAMAKLVPTNAARNLWVGVTPNANFSVVDSGEWELYIVLIDLAATV